MSNTSCKNSPRKIHIDNTLWKAKKIRPLAIANGLIFEKKTDFLTVVNTQLTLNHRSSNGTLVQTKDTLL